MTDVYVKLDFNDIITEIDSNIFMSDFAGYIKIDSGEGNKFARAQVEYLPKGLIDNNGKYNYKLVDGKPVELTEDEKNSLFPTKTVTEPTIADLQAQIFNLTTQLVNGGAL